MQRLEGVVAKLEREDLPLETAIEMYEQGVALARQGQARLAAAEHRLQELTEGDEASPLNLPKSASES
ncbi:MAG: exodeoxyribonuclease VII small subunit [Myxococcales bacterium]|nr:exodeoxyribonuclease VII small subunit [Myxococcales bacterium]